MSNIEVKPKQPPTWQELYEKACAQRDEWASIAKARTDVINSWIRMYDAMKADRDAARAELKKEEGK